MTRRMKPKPSVGMTELDYAEVKHAAAWRANARSKTKRAPEVKARLAAAEEKRARRAERRLAQQRP